MNRATGPTRRARRPTELSLHTPWPAKQRLSPGLQVPTSSVTWNMAFWSGFCLQFPPHGTGWGRSLLIRRLCTTHDMGESGEYLFRRDRDVVRAAPEPGKVRGAQHRERQSRQDLRLEFPLLTLSTASGKGFGDAV